MVNKIAFIVLIIFCAGYQLLAQPTGGGPGGEPVDPVPITGIELLLVSGAALGIGAKRLIRKK